MVPTDEHVGCGYPVAPAQPEDGAVVPDGHKHLGRRSGKFARDLAYDLELVHRLHAPNALTASHRASSSRSVYQVRRLRHSLSVAQI
jgi:hypothetical protein